MDNIVYTSNKKKNILSILIKFFSLIVYINIMSFLMILNKIYLM